MAFDLEAKELLRAAGAAGIMEELPGIAGSCRDVEHKRQQQQGILEVEKVLLGQRDAVWSLLNYVREKCCSDKQPFKSATNPPSNLSRLASMRNILERRHEQGLHHRWASISEIGFAEAAAAQNNDAYKPDGIHTRSSKGDMDPQLLSGTKIAEVVFVVVIMKDDVISG
eukprot:gene20864-27701_t